SSKLQWTHRNNSGPFKRQSHPGGSEWQEISILFQHRAGVLMKTIVSIMAAATACMATGGLVDRVAVVVTNHVVTQSELLREVRLTELMNSTPIDLSVEQRKAAADRLVDQQLIRNEMEIGSYPKPTAEEAAEMLRKFRQEHFASIPLYRAA